VLFVNTALTLSMTCGRQPKMFSVICTELMLVWPTSTELHLTVRRCCKVRWIRKVHTKTLPDARPRLLTFG
jgi:hypothetical protein